jgi:DNA-binding NarL/FixJ family response regulator
VIGVLIADDQTLVRGGFRLILESQPDITVVGEATDGFEAVDLATSLEPDVTLMDIRMPGLDGIQATRRLVRASTTRILILTTFDLDQYVYDAMLAGASGFLLKTVRPQQLTAAVRDAASGDALLAPSITRRLVEAFVKRPRPGDDVPDRFDDLTARELDVLRLVAHGLSNSEIADHLVVSESTAKTHVSRIFTKLALRDRFQAVVLAYESGLVQPGDPTPDAAGRSST